MWNHPSILRLIKDNNNEDPVEIIKNKVRNLVLNAFEEGWEGPPFNPIELARILNLEILPNEEVLDARIIPNNKKFIIEYNPYQRETRINFSLAHEIGHTLFSDCRETIRNREQKLESNFNELEYLCDVAASEILLPYAEFSNEANSVSLTLQSLLDISNKYKASLTSVFLRFCEVVDKSCCILITYFDANDNLIVDYSKKSKSSNLNFTKSFCIPKESSSYECINPGWTAENIESWKIMMECKYKVYSIGLAPIKNSTDRRVGIFIVPEFYDTKLTHNIKTIFGDATKPRGSGIKIIGQVVNTYGGLGAGFGKAMKTNWPKSAKSLKEWKESNKGFLLGESKLTQLNEETYVFQMIAQKGLFPTKNNPRPLNYIALRSCLKELKDNAKLIKASIHIPLIGAGQAKGDWKIIEGMIYDELVLNDIEVIVYMLPGAKIDSINKSVLTLFDEKSIYDTK